MTHAFITAIMNEAWLKYGAFGKPFLKEVVQKIKDAGGDVLDAALRCAVRYYASKDERNLRRKIVSSAPASEASVRDEFEQEMERRFRKADKANRPRGTAATVSRKMKNALIAQGHLDPFWANYRIFGRLFSVVTFAECKKMEQTQHESVCGTNAAYALVKEINAEMIALGKADDDLPAAHITSARMHELRRKAEATARSAMRLHAKKALRR